MSTQQHNSKPTPPPTPPPTPLKPPHLDELPSHQSSASSQSRPWYEDSSHVNPWNSPGPELQSKPLSSFRNTASLGLYNHFVTWHVIDPPSTHLVTPSGLPPSQSSSSSHSRSNVHSNHLTPPSAYEHTAIPPYRSRRADSSSLTMSTIRTNNSTSLGGEREEREREERRKRRGTNSRSPNWSKDNKSIVHHSWWHGSCQVARYGNEYNHIYLRHSRNPWGYLHQSNIDPQASLRSSRTSLSTVVQPITRRWSYIELRRFNEPLHPQPPYMPSQPEEPTSCMDQLVLNYIERRPRSSTFSGSNHRDVIKSIRKTLTTNKLPMLEVPDLITLRRASGPKDSDEMSDTVLGAVGGSGEEVSSSSPSDRYPEQGANLETYLITKKDVDAVTELIRVTLSESQSNANNTSSPLIGHMPQAPTFTERGLVIGAGTIAATTVSPAEVQVCVSDGYDHTNAICVVSGAKTSTPAFVSKKSLHEVIWEGEIPSCDNATSRDEGISPNSIDASEGEVFTAPKLSFPTPLTISMSDTRDAFDLNSLGPGKKEWPFCSPRAEIELVSSSVSEDLDVPAIIPPVRLSRPTLKSCRASVNVPQVVYSSISPSEWMKNDSLHDVLSFPPLPPRSSNDWYSPLPPVDSPTLYNSRSLYDIGLDATCGPQSLDPASQILSPQPSRTSWIRTAECSSIVSRVPSVTFNPDYDVCQEISKPPHKEVPIIKEPLISEEAMVINCSAPEKSKSEAEVTQGIKRVRTMDHAQKGQSSGRWSPFRPPSIYPPAKTPSPSEHSLDDDKQPCMRFERGSTNLNISIDSLDLLRDTSPPPPNVPLPVQDGSEAAIFVMGDYDEDESPIESPHVCDDCAIDPRGLDLGSRV